MRATGLAGWEDRRMILAAYAALLGREPSEQEISHWADRMTNGMVKALPTTDDPVDLLALPS